MKVVLAVSGLPERGTMYLAHIHPGTCGEEEGGVQGHSGQGDSGHEHGTAKEIEYPLSPVRSDEKGEGRAQRWCTTSRSKACFQQSPCKSTSTPPAPETHRRLRAPTLTKRRSPVPYGDQRW